MEAYFERIDQGSFRPTSHTGGGWDPAEMHVAPLCGLLVHAIERHRTASGGAALLLGRVSFDILGRLALDDVGIEVETVRPGRTIELVEATATIAGRAAVRARAWFLTPVDTEPVAGGVAEALPDSASLEPWRMSSVWPGGFVASLRVKPVGAPEPGRSTAWLSTPVALVADERVGPVPSFLALVDTANGIAPRQPPARWIFPNVELTVHLHRQPAGDWVGLDATQVFGPTGQGLTSTVLHDVRGPVGAAHQLLTVRPA